jgi:CRP-like cAMP-binding protein
MYGSLINRLSSFTELSREDTEALQALLRGRCRVVDAHQQLTNEGDSLGTVRFLVDGWICRDKYLEDGRCQILSICLAGDLVDLEGAFANKADHCLRTITNSVVVDIAHSRVEAILRASPRLAQALRCSIGYQSAISREWLLSLGQRTARERCAHLICELFWRLRDIGLTSDAAMDFPLTQEEVGGAIGVSTVHANRVMQDLRLAGLIEQCGKKLKVLDLPLLERAALFNPDFLHGEQIVRSSQPSAERDQPSNLWWLLSGAVAGEC